METEGAVSLGFAILVFIYYAYIKDDKRHE